MPWVDRDKHIARAGCGLLLRVRVLSSPAGIDIDDDPVPQAPVSRCQGHAGRGCRVVQVEYDPELVALVPAVAHAAHNSGAAPGKFGMQLARVQINDDTRLIVQHQQLVTARLVQFKNHAGPGLVLGHVYRFDTRRSGTCRTGQENGAERESEAFSGHA